jgi:hypothetical protein
MAFSIGVQMTGYQFLEVFKGFGRREHESYQAHRKTKPAEIPAGFVSFYGGGYYECKFKI